MLSIAGMLPSEGQKDVNLDSTIEFTIVDDGSTIDQATLVVYINGTKAIDSGAFKSDYNGPKSEIVKSGDNLNAIIDPISNFSVGKVILVKIQVKNSSGKYFNSSYIFKTSPLEPILTLNSPVHRQVLKSAQVLFLQFEDKIDGVEQSTLTVYLNGLVIISSGVFQTGFTGDLSKIIEITNGVSVTIDPNEPLKTGSYIFRYIISDKSGNELDGKLNFSVKFTDQVLPSTMIQTGFYGSFGIVKASDVGCGDSIKLEWNKLKKRYYGSNVYTLIYQNSSRLDIFDKQPKYLAKESASSFTAKGFDAGNRMFFAARALETYNNVLDTSQMVGAATGVYYIPDPVYLSKNLLQDDLRVYVDSVAGYPSSGNLIIGREVVRYLSVDEENSAFMLHSSGRGLSDSTATIHISGDKVSLFVECSDKNTVIASATSTYHDGYGLEREVGGVGVVVNDYTDNDKKFFQGFDFCGYHRPLPQHILQGKGDCGSYLGGEFNGQRGMFLYDRMLNREEVLLDQSGEPIILLKRVWDGQQCGCMHTNRPHPKVKSCKACYGTGYAGGYAQHLNKRREDYKLMVKFKDTLEDLKLSPHSHLEQVYEPQCWTIAMPAIRDRDIVVRFDFSGDIEYMYEVLNVTKEKIMYTHYGRQNLSLKRMDKTDILYTFPFVLFS